MNSIRAAIILSRANDHLLAIAAEKIPQGDGTRAAKTQNKGEGQ
jgi:hypothetical protein